jgi:RNA polymerase sigma factor (sigma-70 family)
VLIILTQAQMVEKLGASAAETFAGFYETYLPKVYRYISYRITDVHTAEDLTSTVFEKALSKFKSYSPQKAQFSTWIFAIARNTLIDHYRGSRNRQTVVLEDPVAAVEADASLEGDSDREEDIRILNGCVALLSKAEQEIIQLKFGAEMTNRQIAGQLSLSESNVGVILYRAVRKLRDNFKGKQNG